MLRLLLVLLITIESCFSVGIHFSKCCDSDSVLRKIDSVYNCTQDLNYRFEIVTNNTNFIEGEAAEGYCVDIEDKVTLFKLNGSEITKEKELEVDFYPKCCPVNYFYNTTTHGCVKSKETLEIFFNEKFVQVGLPQCKIIVDIKLNTKHLERLNGSLHLTKQNKIYDSGFYCVDRDENELFIARICHDDYKICSRMRCIRKCCPDGQSFVNGAKCRNTYIHGLDLSSFSSVMDNINDSFAVVHGHDPSVYRLDPVRFQYHLQNDGVFMQVEVDPSLANNKVTRYYSVEEKAYCIEHAVKKTIKDYYFFRGFPKEQIPVKFLYTRIAMAVSCAFLVLTIIYYCISNEKRTVFGKTLISYCSVCLILFLLLSYKAFASHVSSRKACEVFAFVLFYSTLSIFTWMNIMCIDIYLTFGSFKSFSSRQHRSTELKRFMLYSLYGWGFPMVLTAIPLIFYHVNVLPSALEIIVDMKKCLVYRGDGKYAVFLFSTAPLTLLELCNLVLFILTVVYCLKVKREISTMNDVHAVKGDRKQKLNKFRDRFGLLTKLFLIMGISFLFEVVSTFISFKRNSTTTVIEIIWDTFNCLQGFFIFVIFIVKKRIFKKFGKKMGLERLRKFSLISSAMTQTTSLPTLSSTKQ